MDRRLRHHLPRCRQVGLGIGKRCLGSRHLRRRVAAAGALLGCVQAGFGRLQRSPGRAHLACRSRARRVQLDQRIQIVLRLVALEAGAGNIAGRHLALLLGSVMGGRIQSCLRRLYAALGGGRRARASTSSSTISSLPAFTWSPGCT